MKGIIFTSLAQMIEEKFGLAQWDSLVEDTKLPSCCAYTAGGTYDDAELTALAAGLSAKLNIPAPQLIEAYGEYLFPVLAKSYPQFIVPGMTLKQFAKTIHDVIHVEVRKLYPEASLPTITYEDSVDDHLVMLYRSPRKLCALAIGLLNGAADHFNTPLAIEHPKCMHQGSDHCRLELKFG